MDWREKWRSGSSGRRLIAEDDYEEELLRARDGRVFVYRDVRKTARLWKLYAREVLGETQRYSGVMFVSYNRWFKDHDYRAELADQFGLPGWDKGLDRVPTWGAGSSFDNMGHDGKATNMKVLDRWKNVIDDEIYRAVTRDQEMHDLSRRLFGLIPGTEQLLEPLPGKRQPEAAALVN